MGQGHYVEYGYGCILKNDHPLVKAYRSGEIYDLTDKARERWSGRKAKPKLRLPYESEVFYIAFSLVDCGQNQLDNHPSIIYTAFTIANMKEVLESKGIDFGFLDQEWKLVQEEFKKIGYEIPDAELIAIHDYD